MDRYTGRCDITEITLNTVLNNIDKSTYVLTNFGHKEQLSALQVCLLIKNENKNIQWASKLVISTS